jgi:quercetin dioxygenase-like cupin family protein
MTNAVTSNDPSKVQFRENILAVQEGMLKMIAEGKGKSTLSDCKLTHHYAPIDENYGCGTYARQMFIPKGTLIIGKIHRHQHLNFIMQGKVSVSTEFGPKYFEAPCIFVSEVGLKRAVIAEEDTIWVTVHLTKHLGEENLAKMEEEVIAPSYKELGLIDSTKDLITEN